MKKALLFLCMPALLLASCNKEKDLYQEPTDNKVNNVNDEKQNAEDKLGVTIDQNQTWQMSESRTVSFSLPTDIKVKAIAIMDANPLADPEAAVLAYSDKAVTSMTFEAPTGYSTLYVVCIADNNDIRVAAFNPASGKAEFTTKSYYQRVTKAASRIAAPKRIAKKSELTWTNTYHADHFATDGWSDKYAMIGIGDEMTAIKDYTEFKNVFLSYLSEGSLNYRDKIDHDEAIRNCTWMKVAAGGGEVTVTPVYRNTSCTKSYVGYYYFNANDTERNIKTVEKYIFDESVAINFHNKQYIPEENDTLPAYKLVYYDKDGNASYNFPEGTVIGFFNGVYDNYNAALPKTLFNWYNLGQANLELSKFFESKGLGDTKTNYNPNWASYAHTVMFERGGTKFIGFEDWIKDFDMNDIVLMLEGSVEAMPAAGINTENSHVFSYAFEDTRLGDYDMNDVVLRAWRPTLKEQKIKVQLVAVGAYDNIKVYYNDPLTNQTIALFDGKEAHQAFRDLGYADDNLFINTQSQNATVYPETIINVNGTSFNYYCADFYIVNETKGIEVHVPSATGEKGLPPYGICVPTKWAWPTERTCIKDAYPYFNGFASNMGSNLDWYLKAENGKVFILK